MATCASCGTNNVEGTKFCVSCGATLAPAPGSWRAGTDELQGQTPGSSSSAPTGSPSSSYAPNPSTPPVYSAPQPTAMYAQTAGVPGVFGQLRYAEWLDRVLAALIDGALTFALMIVLFFIFGALTAASAGVGGGDDNPLVGGVLCMGMLVTVVSVFGLGIFNKIYLVSKRGASIGQGVMNLKVVDATGNVPPMGTLLIRLLVQVGMSFVPFLSIFLVLLDVLWPLWDEQKQTLHDKAAGTFVVKTG